MPSYKEDTDAYEKERVEKLSSKEILAEIKERYKRISSGENFLMPSDVYVMDVGFLLKKLGKGK
jgi:hypothetical protein